MAKRRGRKKKLKQIKFLIAGWNLYMCPFCGHQDVSYPNRYDLKGYPKLQFGYEPHIASLIVSICDVYDSFSQRRSYKYDYPPEKIYNLMMREKGKAFEPDLLDAFFKITGVWPIGTVVLLSDNRVAIVRQESENDIFRPKIEVIEPQDRKEIINLEDRKEDLKIERALNPFTEAKIYLHLI